MFFSIAVCTRNRADWLARTLASIAETVRPPSLAGMGGCSCRYGVATIPPQWSPAFRIGCRIRLVREPIPGVANARNAEGSRRRVNSGMGDNDVVVRKDWIAAYLEAFSTWPEAVMFAGRILPVLEEPSPASFARWFRF